jgi:hypothetical protein|nr:MAG TPA: hypothetical protein [Caudoviricetes sp.]
MEERYLFKAKRLPKPYESRVKEFGGGENGN